MARYEVTLSSPLSHRDAWDRMADVTRFAEWDPGVVASKQVQGDGPGPTSSYLLTLKGIRRTFDLQYEVVDFVEGEKLLLVADSEMLRSEDTVTVKTSPTGSTVTYEAELTLQGLGKVFTPAIGFVFNRIGDRAADGLRDFLEV